MMDCRLPPNARAARKDKADEGMPRCRVAGRVQREVLLRTLIALLQHLGSTQ